MGEQVYHGSTLENSKNKMEGTTEMDKNYRKMETAEEKTNRAFDSTGFIITQGEDRISVTELLNRTRAKLRHKDEVYQGLTDDELALYLEDAIEELEPLIDILEEAIESKSDDLRDLDKKEKIKFIELRILDRKLRILGGCFSESEIDVDKNRLNEAYSEISDEYNIKNDDHDVLSTNIIAEAMNLKELNSLLSEVQDIMDVLENELYELEEHSIEKTANKFISDMAKKKSYKIINTLSEFQEIMAGFEFTEEKLEELFETEVGTVFETEEELEDYLDSIAEEFGNWVGVQGTYEDKDRENKELEDILNELEDFFNSEQPKEEHSGKTFPTMAEMVDFYFRQTEEDTQAIYDTLNNLSGEYCNCEFCVKEAKKQQEQHKKQQQQQSEIFPYKRGNMGYEEYRKGILEREKECNQAVDTKSNGFTLQENYGDIEIEKLTDGVYVIYECGEMLADIDFKQDKIRVNDRVICDLGESVLDKVRGIINSDKWLLNDEVIKHNNGKTKNVYSLDTVTRYN